MTRLVQHSNDDLSAAAKWFSFYILGQEDIEMTGVLVSLECGSDEDWNSHIEFVADCLAAGVNPAPFADAIIDQQKIFNDNQITEDDFPVTVRGLKRLANGYASTVDAQEWASQAMDELEIHPELDQS